MNTTTKRPRWVGVLAGLLIFMPAWDTYAHGWSYSIREYTGPVLGLLLWIGVDWLVGRTRFQPVLRRPWYRLATFWLFFLGRLLGDTLTGQFGPGSFQALLSPPFVLFALVMSAVLWSVHTGVAAWRSLN